MILDKIQNSKLKIRHIFTIPSQITRTTLRRSSSLSYSRCTCSSNAAMEIKIIRSLPFLFWT